MLIEAVRYISYCCFCLNELFSVFQEICIQRTLMNNILLILFFVLYCIFLHFNISFEKIHYIFLPLCGVKTKIPLTVLNCHAILIDNVCRLLLKSMLPTMFIQLCVTFKHIHLASYVGVKELAAKVNAAVL